MLGPRMTHMEIHTFPRTNKWFYGVSLPPLLGKELVLHTCLECADEGTRKKVGTSFILTSVTAEFMSQQCKDNGQGRRGCLE